LIFSNILKTSYMNIIKSDNFFSNLNFKKSLIFLDNLLEDAPKLLI